MSTEADAPTPERSENGKLIIEPPVKHKAADRAGKILGNMAGSINKALGADDEPVVLDRKGPHSSIRELEDLIDKALEETQSSRE